MADLVVFLKLHREQEERLTLADDARELTRRTGTGDLTPHELRQPGKVLADRVVRPVAVVVREDRPAYGRSEVVGDVAVGLEREGVAVLDLVADRGRSLGDALDGRAVGRKPREGAHAGGLQGEPVGSEVAVLQRVRGSAATLGDPCCDPVIGQAVGEVDEVGDPLAGDQVVKVAVELTQPAAIGPAPEPSPQRLAGVHEQALARHAGVGEGPAQHVEEARRRPL